jgi:hypothetical protein
MTARFALLPDRVRRVLALSLAALSLALPALLIWVSVSGVMARGAAHEALHREVSALRAALSETAVAPAGASISDDVNAADTRLTQRADAIAGALERAGASLLQSGFPETVSAGGVSERRLSLTAAGSPDALAGALTEAAQDPALAVSFVQIDAPRDGTVQARLVLVEVLAEVQP